MVDRFNALAARGNLDFEAWFNERRATDRSWDVEESTWRFRYRYIPTFKVGGRSFRVPLPLLERKVPDVLVSLYAEPTFLLGWIIAKLRRRRTAFRMLATSDNWVQRRWWKERLKRFLFWRVDGVETPGNQARRYAMRYGVPEHKIFYARHTVDVEHFMRGSAAASIDREDFRARLGLHGVTYIYVGRLWWGKGVNYLLDAFRDVQDRVSESEVSLLLLGDGADEAKLREQCRINNVRNVVFGGFKQKPELPRFYASGDVFVFPTLGDPYGLVVDEAMACSLPIISTSEAGEIADRVDEGINGYVVPAGDSRALAAKMEVLARDAMLRSEMGRASFEKVKGHTAAGWAEDFEAAIISILGR
jgi:glycosyltransferase involved in cell wall biosynthesis